MRVLFIYVLSFVCTCYGQDIVWVNQKGEKLNYLEIDISIPQKHLDFYKFNGQTYEIIQDTVNSHISIHVHGNGCLKEYYNEYTVKQFLKLDTLVLYENCLIRDYTPRIFLENFDEWKEDTIYYKWFKSYLEEIKFEQSDKLIEISVKSIYKDLSSKINKILKYKSDIADIFGIPESRLNFKFTDEFYVTRDTDLFYPGRVIDKEFINKQNTKSMIEYAKKFKIVGEINIVGRVSD